MTSHQLEFSGLSHIDLKSDHPIDLYTEWECEANKFLSGLKNVMCLATVSRNCTPRSRHVFLRYCDKTGFVFFTDSRGRKSLEIDENNNASMSIYWIYTNDKNENIMKQVRIEGIIEKLSRDEVEIVYNAEPFYAKIRSHLCHQDTKVDWHELKQRHDHLVEQATIDKSLLKMPNHYVGYRLKPTWMDFYLAKDNFIADRIEFEKIEGIDNWIHRRLAA